MANIMSVGPVLGHVLKELLPDRIVLNIFHSYTLSSFQFHPAGYTLPACGGAFKLVIFQQRMCKVYRTVKAIIFPFQSFGID